MTEEKKTVGLTGLTQEEIEERAKRISEKFLEGIEKANKEASE